MKPESFRPSKKGFTLVELLVVITVIALLAALLLPALAHSKEKARGIICLNNVKQMQIAWIMYADDNHGELAPNLSVTSPTEFSWVQGYLDYSSSSQNTNVQLLLDAKFAAYAPYIASASTYHCPSDRTSVKILGATYARVRSYGMNWAIGWPSLSPYKTFNRLSDISGPLPSNLFVMIDQHPDYVSDIHFHMDMVTGVSAKFLDYPASSHGGVGTISFADGRAELHKWKDPRTIIPVKRIAHFLSGNPSPNNPDIAWLQQRYSALK